MASRNQKNSFLAGILVVTTILASVVVITILSGVLDTLGTSMYTVRFDLVTNVGGLQPGAEVRVGGRRVGVVNGVEFIDNNGKIEGIEVGIRVDKRVRLHEDAVATLELPLLGTQGVINFPDLGTGVQLAEGGTLPGVLAPPSFLSQAGFGDEQRGDLQNILAKTSGFADRLDALGGGAQDAVDNAKSIVADVRTEWDSKWNPRIDRVTENLDTTVAKGPQLAGDLQARVDEVKTLLATGQAYLDDNRERVNETLENARGISADGKAFTERLNSEIADSVLELFDTGKVELTRAGDAVAKYGQILDEQRPNIRKSLGNFRLASDQLRNTLVEVRRSPWRLIYRPDTKELQYELLYDAARTYASALSDLRAASESLEEMTANGTTDPARMNELLERLDNAFDGYKDAEQLFIERIGEEAEGVGGE